MKTFSGSYNSKADLMRQIDSFKAAHPNTVLDNDSFRVTEAAAMRLDNEPPCEAGARMSFEISYMEV